MTWYANAEKLTALTLPQSGQHVGDCGQCGKCALSPACIVAGGPSKLDLVFGGCVGCSRIYTVKQRGKSLSPLSGVACWKHTATLALEHGFVHVDGESVCCPECGHLLVHITWAKK